MLVAGWPPHSHNAQCIAWFCARSPQSRAMQPAFTLWAHPSWDTHCTEGGSVHYGTAHHHLISFRSKHYFEVTGDTADLGPIPWCYISVDFGSVVILFGHSYLGCISSGSLISSDVIKSGSPKEPFAQAYKPVGYINTLRSEQNYYNFTKDMILQKTFSNVFSWMKIVVF